MLLPIGELPTDALLLGQLRDLCDLCQRQDGKTLALVGWYGFLGSEPKCE